MPTCPSGHESTATDYCDVCGMRIGAPSAVAPSPAAASEAAPSEAAPSAPAASSDQPCPQCGAGRTGNFCEACGYDFAGPAPEASPTSAAPPASAAPPVSTAPPASSAPPVRTAPPVSTAPPTTPSPRSSQSPAGPGAATPPNPAWVAVATADRAYFDRVIAAAGPDAASVQFPAYCPERRFELTGGEMRIGRRSASRGLDPEIDLTGPPTDPGISHLHAVLIAQPDGTWSVIDPGSSNGTQVNGADISPDEPVPLHDGDRISLGAWTVLAIHAG